MRKEERKAKWSKQKTPQSERLSAKRNGGGINKHWQNEGRRRQTRQKLSSELREKENEKIEAAFRLVKVSQSESGHGNVSSGRRRRERDWQATEGNSTKAHPASIAIGKFTFAFFFSRSISTHFNCCFLVIFFYSFSCCWRCCLSACLQ